MPVNEVPVDYGEGEKRSQDGHSHVEEAPSLRDLEGEDIEHKITKETVLACIVRLTSPSSPQTPLTH